MSGMSDSLGDTLLSAADPAAAETAESETSCGKVTLFFFLSILVFVGLPAATDTDKGTAPGTNCSTFAYCTTYGFDVVMTKLLVAPAPLVRGVGYGSHVLTMGISPLLALGSAAAPLYPCITRGSAIHAAQDASIVIAVVLFSLGFNTLCKYGVQRQRPCFHYGMQVSIPPPAPLSTL
jgi:hypothetical protein